MILNISKIDSGSLFIYILFAIYLFASCKGNSSPNEQILYDFEDDMELNEIDFKCKTRFEISHKYKKNGESSLKMEFYPTDGIVGFILKPKMMSPKFNKLSFWVYNPEGSITYLNVKASSKNAEVLKKQIGIAPGNNEISLVLKENLRGLKRNYIDSIALYLIDNKHIKTLYFDFFKHVKKTN